MRLRVIDRSGEPPHLARALLRVVGLGLAIIPLFAGFLPVLFDARRRGIHDLLARHHGDSCAARRWRLRRR